METTWWDDGESCTSCGIPFCHPHRPRARKQLVWVGPSATAYHEGPMCGATPSGVTWLARGVTVLQFDFDGETAQDPDGKVDADALDGIPARHSGVPPGWKQVTVAEAVAHGLPACLRC